MDRQTGIDVDTELARQAGVTVGDGIVVDEQLRTSQPDVYAAGDVASFLNPALGKRMRVEHEDNANTMGDVAGQNMAGAGGNLGATAVARCSLIRRANDRTPVRFAITTLPLVENSESSNP